jgi:hypothetical protein
VGVSYFIVGLISMFNETRTLKNYREFKLVKISIMGSILFDRFIDNFFLNEAC